MDEYNAKKAEYDKKKEKYDKELEKYNKEYEQYLKDYAAFEKQYEKEWNLLVPGNGKANTLQGEVIRIAGRINDELLHNGMGNWDRDYRKMLSIISNFLKQGNSLTTEQLAEVAHIQKNILEDDGTLSHRLCKLTTLWVSQNPNPIELEKVPYNR